MALKLTTPAPSGFTILNGAAGTALTGATTITVSGLAGYNQYFIYIAGASSANASAQFRLQINADAGSNYYYALTGILGTAASAIGTNPNTYYILGTMGNAAADTVTAFVQITGAIKSGIMPIRTSSIASGATTNASYSGTGHYNAAAQLSSVSLISSTGNFDAGTLYVYGQ